MHRGRGKATAKTGESAHRGGDSDHQERNVGRRIEGTEAVRSCSGSDIDGSS
jgi:hypothetical protein